jgi:hypothetical protein
MACTPERPTKTRQGRFLWMPENNRTDYLVLLRRKIEQGYFFTEPVLTRLVEELAPTYSESVNDDYP